ncbi:unnamed protein product [Fusarium graminearum]|nr:unnamed protein product [Fusarium graminearum]
MFTCGTCWRQFPAGWQSRQQHMNATGHEAPEFECKTCDRYFSSQKAVQQHMNHLDHWDESSESEYIVYGCDHCDDEFDDEDELHDHEARDHFYCVVCSRTFQDLHSITQHLRGKVHRITTVQCPFCKDSQGTATGLAYHLERGCCSKAPLNRDKLYAAIRQRDPGGIISNRLLTWSGTLSTLKDRHAGARHACTSHQKELSLSPEQEDDLERYIMEREPAFQPLTRTEIRGFAQQLSEVNGQLAYIGKNWVDRFFTRHPAIEKKHTKVFESSRKRAVTRKSLSDYYRGLEWVIDTKNISKSYIYNTDENGMQIGETNAGIVAGTTLTAKSEVIKSDNSTWASVLEELFEVIYRFYREVITGVRKVGVYGVAVS